MIEVTHQNTRLEPRASAAKELALTPALSPRRGRIVGRLFVMTNDFFGFTGSHARFGIVETSGARRCPALCWTSRSSHHYTTDA